MADFKEMKNGPAEPRRAMRKYFSDLPSKTRDFYAGVWLSCAVPGRDEPSGADEDDTRDPRFLTEWCDTSTPNSDDEEEEKKKEMEEDAPAARGRKRSAEREAQAAPKPKKASGR